MTGIFTRSPLSAVRAKWAPAGPQPAPAAAPPVPPATGTRIADVRWRQHACVTGQVHTVRIQPLASVPSLECTLVDDSGGLTVVFLGRRKIAGIHPGTRMRVEGVAGNHRGQLAILNPRYELIAPES